MKKVKIGDVVELKKEHNDVVSSSIEKSNSMESEIDSMCQRIFEMKKNHWNFINECYPELKNFQLSYNMETKSVTITGIKGGG